MVEADAATLERVLRGLAAYGAVVEHPGRRFAASPMGELLCADRPGAQRGAMLARGQVYYAALGGLLAAVRSGGVPFESVHGERFFTHLAAHPELVGAFQASMRDRSAREAAAVVAAYDFAVFGTVVDVGGGGGRAPQGDPRRRAGRVGRAVRPSRGRPRSRRCPPWRATSSSRCPRAPTPTCCPASSTTGPTPTPSPSCGRAGGRWPTPPGSCSWRPSCPSGRPTTRPRSGWTCTCSPCSGAANGPARSTPRCSPRPTCGSRRSSPADPVSGVHVFEARPRPGPVQCRTRHHDQGAGAVDALDALQLDVAGGRRAADEGQWPVRGRARRAARARCARPARRAPRRRGRRARG